MIWSALLGAEREMRRDVSRGESKREVLTLVGDGREPSDRITLSKRME